MRRTILASKWLSALCMGGTVLQLGGCSVSSLLSLAGTINPCGSLLNCNPAEYQLATRGPDGLGTTPDTSPFCTVPPYCGPATDPIFGGILGP